MTNPNRPQRRILLIGWDAADWEHITPLLDQGLLPTLSGLIGRGVMGNLATLQPMLSPMLWNSVATGKYAYKHGIHGFVEPLPGGLGARPYSSRSRKCKAIWNILSQEAWRCNVINWWASHPAEPINGCVVSNLFNGIRIDPKFGLQAADGTIHPADRTEYLRQFKVFPQELTSEQICAFIPRAAEIVQDEDSRLQMFAQTLAETLTTHSVATAVMESEPWDFMAVYYTAIDHFSHGFMQYHPPRQPHIDEKDFEIFKDVVTGAYRFSDMMLERLLQLAGPETTIVLCSDHGFHSRELRPLGTPREPAGPAIWHRRYGIVALAGPGIKEDERIYGASLIDIGPTLLTLCGLPVGNDMDGRPLLEAFVDPPKVESIPSWDDRPGPAGMLTGEDNVDPDQAADLMQQFVALGYIDNPNEDKAKQAEEADNEAKYNVARNLAWAGHLQQAVEILEDLVRRYPWESRFIDQLASTYVSAGFIDDAECLIRSAYDISITRNAAIQLLWIEVQIFRGNLSQASQAMKRLENSGMRSPAVFNKIGDFYLRARRLAEAQRMFEKALSLQADYPEAWLGLSNVFRRLGKNQETADAALNAVGLIHRLPKAHFNLGVALSRAGQGDQAVLAFETALKFAPKMIQAHRWMAWTQRNLTGNIDKASQHAEIAARLGHQATAERKVVRPRERRLANFPAFDSEQRRDEIVRERRPANLDARKKSGKTFVIVSGLPRSGTSLMMQMLEAGGLPAKTDAQRVADEDNPHGYYEWEDIKRIKTHPQLLDEPGLDARAIKVISMLLPFLPYRHEYLVIFMVRPIEEIVASQAKMIERRGTSGSTQDRDQLVRELMAHRAQTIQQIRHNDRIKLLEMGFATLIAQPNEAIQQIVEFLGAERLSKPENMKTVIDRPLHRNRST